MAAEIRRVRGAGRTGADVPREPGAARPAVVLRPTTGTRCGRPSTETDTAVCMHIGTSGSVPMAVARLTVHAGHRARRRQRRQITLHRPACMSRIPRTASRRSSSPCRRAASVGCRSPSSAPTASGSDTATGPRWTTPAVGGLPPQLLGLLHRRGASASRPRHHIGVDRILWECDYPHADTPWPHSQKEVAESLPERPRRRGGADDARQRRAAVPLGHQARCRRAARPDPDSSRGPVRRNRLQGNSSQLRSPDDVRSIDARMRKTGDSRKLGEILAERIEDEIIAAGWPVGTVSAPRPNCSRSTVSAGRFSARRSASSTTTVSPRCAAGPAAAWSSRRPISTRGPQPLSLQLATSASSPTR